MTIAKKIRMYTIGVVVAVLFASLGFCAMLFFGHSASAETAPSQGAQFVARADIVYDRAKVYTVDNSAELYKLNELLTENSKQITSDMTVRISAYRNAGGTTTDVMPTTIGNAGTYTLTVTASDNAEQDLVVTIKRKRISFQNIEFVIRDLNGLQTLGQLESVVLYKAQNGTYTTENNNTEPINAINAVASYTHGGVRLGLDIGSLDKYVRYTDTIAVQSTLGKVETVVRIDSIDPNCEPYLEDPAELYERGIVIDFSKYTITKTWYYVQYTYTLTDTDGNGYEYVPEHMFGESPKLKRVSWSTSKTGEIDVANAYETTTEQDAVYLSLYRNGDVIGERFRRTKFDYYINSSMPVGNYKLKVEVEGNRITRTLNYRVTPATMVSDLRDGFLSALADDDGANTMVVEWDGYMHVFDAATRVKYDALKNSVAESAPDRVGIWANEKYDDLYGELAIEFNMDGMHTVKYYGEQGLEGFDCRPSAPNVYTLYYKISAKNFEAVTPLDESDVDYETQRRKYAYNVVIKRAVAMPDAVSVVYNGSEQRAGIVGDDLYIVASDSGHTDVGVYAVQLRLRTPECYYWQGKALGESTATVNFTITKAQNDWEVNPDIVRWIEGRYSAFENKFVGKARFGDIVYVVTDTQENVVFDASRKINKLGDLDAGVYIIRATVIGTDNYNGLSEAFTFRVLEKVGLPWWGVLLIVLGALGVAAAVIFVLLKKGVFQILTGKLTLAIRTRASIDATIASVRAAKKMEEGRRSVEEAKRRESLSKLQDAPSIEDAKADSVQPQTAAQTVVEDLPQSQPQTPSVADAQSAQAQDGETAKPKRKKSPSAK